MVEDIGVCTLPLVTLWDFLGSQTFGMAQFYRGLQGDGRVLKFQQYIYNAKTGRNLPDLLTPILQGMAKRSNKHFFTALSQKTWILGGQQFAHLFSEADLENAVAIVFDLLALDYPDGDIQTVSIDQHKRKIKNISFAKQIVTISQYSKQRIIAHYNVDPIKVSVVPIGINSQQFRVLTEEEKQFARSRFQIPQASFVILYVGSEQRRKNLSTLVHAFSQVRKSVEEVFFLKVGKPQSASGRSSFERELVGCGLEASTRIIDYASDEELAQLYGLADLFVFPSVGEGFGVPLLEAMASGIPVLTTRCSSIPEVVGDVALTVEDPYDSYEWHQLIRTVIDSADTRKSMSIRGRLRATQMQWDNSRLKFLNAIDPVTKPFELL